MRHKNELFVLTPGIMGTEIVLPTSDSGKPDRVWPPTWDEVVFWRYDDARIDRLMSKDAVHGDLISHVCHLQFYRPLLKLLHACEIKDEKDAQLRLLTFPYDWRADLFDTAKSLAVALDEEAVGRDRITLIGHSMGGLVCRLVLESGLYDERAWFSKIDRFISLGTPHRGAPLALARVLGLDAAFGIRPEGFVRMSQCERWPSGYQLLPAPGEASCWNQSSSSLEPVDIYDQQIGEMLGLNLQNISRARKLHEALDPTRGPEGLQRIAVATGRRETVTRINLFEEANGFDMTKAHVTKSEGSGDGTVPVFSSTAMIGAQHLLVDAPHATVFDAPGFEALMKRLSGGSTSAVLLDNSSGDALAPTARISLSQVSIQAGEHIEVVLTDAHSPIGDVTIEVESVDGAGGGLSVIDAIYTWSVPAKLQESGWVGIRLPPVDQPGLFRFTLRIGDRRVDDAVIAIATNLN